MNHLDFLFNEFHPIKNHPKLLIDFKPQSNKKVWWKCSKNPDHEWEASLCNRNKGSRCPMCSGRIIDKTNNLLVKFPELGAEWHTSKNTLRPNMVASGSNKIAWWKCSKNPEHEWEAAPNTRVKGNGCPHCTGRTTFGGNTVKDKFPHLVKEWDSEKNGTLTPADVCPKSDKKVWWICPEKKHSYETKIGFRTSGTGCPICKNRKVVIENSLSTLFPNIAAEWHPTKNKKHPSEILPNYSKKVWWKCSSNHEWEATPTNRSRFLNQCPACSGRIASPEKNLLLAHPDIAAEWHPTKNGSKKPEDFTPSSHSKVWWICPKNPKHEFESIIGNRTIGNRSGCPFCNQSKMEKTVHNLLKEKCILFDPQKKFSDLQFRGNQLSYDFFIPELNAAIECDGRQHFEEATDYFHHQKSFHHQRLRDVIKNAFAAREGISLLRIAYTEVDYIPALVETFLNRLQKGERPFNFVGNPYKFLYKLQG
jgi:very-short-patch-repair endonuclease